MKYNRELYSISKITKHTNNNINDEKRIALLQNRLLKLMVEKIKNAKDDENVLKDGFMKMEFFHESGYYTEPGFDEITELLNSNNFHIFAGEYCIYLNKEPSYLNSGYFPDCYELVWYYKDYFEKMSEEIAIQRKLKNNKGEN